MPRTIFITDAASSLGKACAVRVGRAGWNVIMGASSLSSLRDVCQELPDAATLPMRCVPTDKENIDPVLKAGEDRFGAIDAILINNEPRRVSWRRAMDMQIIAVSAISRAARPYLLRSQGQLVVAGSRVGSQTMADAMHTVARDAKRTLCNALAADWAEDPVRVKLVEPAGLEGPATMARNITRALNTSHYLRTVPNRDALARQG